MTRPWREINKETVLRAKVFAYEKVFRESPETEGVGQFDILRCPDWVNVIAEKDDKYVMVKQYRHGTTEYTCEIPGGAIDSGEEPLAAAKRELLEETGFCGKDWQLLGKVSANPAFMTNHCYTYFCEIDGEQGEQNLDPFEEVEVQLLEKEKVSTMIMSGEIHHSLVVAAFGLSALR